MEITTYDFTYDGKKLSDFNMILCHYGENADGSSEIGGLLEFTTAKSIGSDISKKVDAIYSGNLTTTIQICKDIRDEKLGRGISPYEVRAILKWLGQKDFHVFKIEQWGYEDIQFNGSFNNFIQHKINGVVYCIEATLVTDRPYGYSEKTDEFSLTPYNPHRIVFDDDEVGSSYIKKIVCTCRENGELQLWNELDEKKMILKNCASGESITLYGDIKYIASSNLTRNLSNDFNFTFIKLYSDMNNSVNRLYSNMVCDISVTYEEVRKVGL